MTIRARAAVIAIACGLCACEAAGQGPAASQAPETTASVAEPAAPADDTPMYTIRAVIAPTPEMLKAALTNDPDAMRDSISAAAGTCQAATTCPAQFASCTAWSTPTLCSETCGPGVCLCHPVIDCDGEDGGTRGRDTYNSFRICFDPSQNACTQWSSTTSTFCGC